MVTEIEKQEKPTFEEFQKAADRFVKAKNEFIESAENLIKLLNQIQKDGFQEREDRVKKEKVMDLCIQIGQDPEVERVGFRIKIEE